MEDYMKNKLTVLTNCDIDSALWVDYVENELTPTLRSDLELHLENCKLCQSHIAEYKTLKMQIKQNPIPMPGDDFFKALQGKIMSSLDKPLEGDIQELTSSTKWYSKSRNFIIPFVATAALFILIFTSLVRTTPFNGAKSVETAQARLEDAFIDQAAERDPKMLTDSMISSGDSEEVILNAAAEKMARMSDKEVRALMKRMR
jgi:hypothetical protein